jgi:hypothetical protein
MFKLASMRVPLLLSVSGTLLLVSLCATPAANASTLYACLKKHAASVHVFTKKPKCDRGETRLSWNTSGPAGPKGSNGANGTNGANGENGTSGTSGTNGALGGFSRTVSEVDITTATEEKPVTVLTLPLPAGDFIVSANVALNASKTGKSGEQVAVSCALTDTPSGRPTETLEQQDWGGVLNFLLFTSASASTNLPFDGAVSSPASPSTLAVSCFEILPPETGVKVNAGPTVVTAIQTTSNQ